MPSNKETLQEHNIDLSEIIQIVKNLSSDGSVAVIDEGETVTGGLYAWKQYAIGEKFTEKSSKFSAKKVVDATTAGKELSVFYANAITRDAENGLFTLVSPKEWELNSNGTGATLAGDTFFMFGTTTSNKVWSNPSSSSSSTVVRNDPTNGATIEPASSALSVTTLEYVVEPDYTFLKYVTSDDESAFPDKAVLDEYYYERI